MSAAPAKPTDGKTATPLTAAVEASPEELIKVQAVIRGGIARKKVAKAKQEKAAAASAAAAKPAVAGGGGAAPAKA